MPTVGDVAAFFNRFTPPALAAEWDNVGLLVGDQESEVHKLMTCLTVTRASAQEALDAGANLIVSHHPVLFRPVQKLTTATAEGAILWSLARGGIAVFSPHTALDNATGGINDLLARRLALTDVRPLRLRPTESQCKIIVFVPERDLAAVSDALFRAGAGHIGNYTECSYRLMGTGTFFGSDAANPTVGQKGRREEVSEFRLEVLCSRSRVATAIAAMCQAHSYEEPAYDVYPLEPSPATQGEGRIGRLSQSLSLRVLGQRLKESLGLAYLQFVGDSDKQVATVALACGSAGEFLHDAVRAGADVFLTGEMRFHDLLFAQSQGISLLLPGHYATERHAVEELAGLLERQWPGLTVWASRQERDALQLLT
jgi:dinuclear metal center YbgI/SA1388 family protein